MIKKQRLKKMMLISLIIIQVFTINVYAESRILIYDGGEYQYTNANVNVVINGHQVSTPEIVPMIIGGRTMVPVREIFESNQINAIVDWVDETRTVIISKDDLQVELSIGDNKALVNGKSIDMDVPAMLIQDKAVGIYKTMVPIRFVAEVMGYNVEWYEETKTVGLFSPGISTDEIVTNFSNIEFVSSSKEVLSLPTGLAMEEKVLEVLTISEGTEIEDYKDEFTNHRTDLKSITSNEDGSVFYIKSAEGMSGINYFIWDNKLVMDIKGIYMTDIDSLIPFESEYIEKVRSSQYDVIDLTGRIVFDLIEGARPKKIVIHEDRQQIDIVFNEKGITDIAVHQDELGDFIKLEGDYSNAEILRMKYPWRLIIDINQESSIEEPAVLENVDGQFIREIRLLSLDTETTRIIVDTADMCDYILQYDEETNSTYIRLSETDMGDLKYSIEDYPTITLDKTIDTTYSITYDYHEMMTNIELNNIPSTFEFSEFFTIGDNYYESIQFEKTEEGGVLKVKGKHIYEMFAIENEDSLKFYCRRPRDIYETIVVIDPGHGGTQPGTGWNGLTEKDINLKIFNYFKAYADLNSSIKYYYTREEDITLNLSPRTIMANDLKADLYVSMHNNAMDIIMYPSKADIRGLEVITTKDRENSATEVALGELVFENFGSMLPELVLRSIKDNNNLYVINHTEMPSIIIEYAYVSNKEDAENLKNERILQEIGRITELTINEFLIGN